MRLRDIERTLNTLKQLDPEHAHVIARAVGTRGNLNQRRQGKDEQKEHRTRKVRR